MRRSWSSALPILGLFLLILLSLYFMGYAAQKSDWFGEIYVWILIFNIALMIILGVLIAKRLAGIVVDLIRGVEGSRLTSRLVLMFIFVAVVPVFTVWAFSVRFLSSGIDRWFDVEIEASLGNALELSQRSLSFYKDVRAQQTRDALAKLQNVSLSLAGVMLDDTRKQLGAAEMTLLGPNNRIIATSSRQLELIVPKFPAEDVMVQLGSGQTYSALEPVGKGGLQIRVVTRIRGKKSFDDTRVLMALYPLPERVSQLANSVQQSYLDYKRLEFLRKPLKQSYRITLSLVLLLSTLFAVWAAFFMARRLLSPILELASATRSVAEGDYRRRLPVMHHDELGFLAQSFNQMTARIRTARESAELSKRLVENQRSYLEAVLGHLSSGVLTLDAEMKIRTANETTDYILEMDQPLESFIGQHIADVARSRPVLQSFYDKLIGDLIRSRAEWRRQLTLFGENGRKVLICRGVHLPDDDEKGNGYAIVIDDVTDLIRAQRDAAWGEVARRLAHEIKNPLTPIQLSAERLQHKLKGELRPELATVLSRATGTIIKQVDAMKAMVNAFRDYASSPPAKLEEIDLNQILQEVAELYQGFADKVTLELELDPELPSMKGDAVRIRQLLHNLIKNAMEAADRPIVVHLKTLHVESGQEHYIQLEVTDNGEGIPEEMLDNLFEPYVTTKTRGTGLGLAVVKKIVEEHGGVVMAANLPDSGARFTIRLPTRWHGTETLTEQNP
ncbi:MAG TPA: HAMP domain-containing protein [Gammaproteobacteria bacterium]|nr:HAMP domain-containing protein [Gammaproteobacteria bacterium]